MQSSSSLGYRLWIALRRLSGLRALAWTAASRDKRVTDERKPLHRGLRWSIGLMLALRWQAGRMASRCWVLALLGLIPPERCAGQTLGLIDSLPPMELDEPSASSAHSSGVAEPSVAQPWTQRLQTLSAPLGLIQDTDFPTPPAPVSTGVPDRLIAPTATDLWSGHDLRMDRDHWANDRYRLSPLVGQLGDETTDWNEADYEWQWLPPGLMYRSYLAGEKEPRMGWSALYDLKRERTVWETALGGRVGLLRYGTPELDRPQGFQIDAEGAVFTRLLPSEPSTMMEAADFRFGVLGTWRRQRWAAKAGYYHISSHLGDEFMIAFPTFPRVNYVRDAAVVGLMYDVTPQLQTYAEMANALGIEGGAKPWEFQFGAQFTPPPHPGHHGAPYAGINTYLREDFNFGGSLNVIVGWNWVGQRTGQRLRIGMQYYNGPSLQYSFVDRRDRLLGGGLWFDY